MSEKLNKNAKPAALSGIRVLDLSRYISGPFCGQILGDLGADVVKVERVDGGEEGRRVGEMINGETLFFLGANRNKRSLTVDFRHPEGQALLKRLAAKADILIENFRPGTLEKMGLGYDEISAVNPGLIVVRITGFGQEGPMASHPCFDGAAQAHSGLMTLTGQPDGPPTMAGVFVADYSTALYGTIAALAALQSRQATGRGQVVEATLMDSAMSMLTTAIGESILLGVEQTRLGNRDRYLAPSHCFESRDGRWIYVVAGNNQHFDKFVAVMGMAQLARDPRFSNPIVRNRNVAELEAIINEWGLKHDGAEILDLLHEAEIPCEPVSTIADVIANPQVVHRRQVVDIPHPREGTVPVPAPAMKMSATPPCVHRGPPSLGAHTGEVLAEWLGMEKASIDETLRAGYV
ncbi:CaiB/BaiF CoA transferase family protein [Chelatococcus asaccharovorans]|uniref:CaiB/BaiF CoA transferase family protein n=1 Tax=Chelatococcus asaccharovorans TaxID=28210 RepID=UPI00224C6B2E|nr:CoA transferase [Chelatococcus asaccharovorans]CAH1655384.1 Crotonobetainyl-CoA:carnitine CoA-transferase CaiB-like acyl-CoA transferase [Chelatococcus asaccharovorans]CAH1685443.1 Crotonobetainyl-CoA:carnitine CoA-transferase CaiB-like acyl-CoA transferase [Chelatococcus asaccharovorans]